jgi:hypothetical protein
MHMTVRITQTNEGKTTVLRVDGWLRGESVDELARAVEKAGPNVALELPDLRATDERGIQVLRYLADQGAELRHLPPSIALLLHGPVADDAPSADLDSARPAPAKKRQR